METRKRDEESRADAAQQPLTYNEDAADPNDQPVAQGESRKTAGPRDAAEVPASGGRSTPYHQKADRPDTSDE